jgi:hypothetical protein
MTNMRTLARRPVLITDLATVLVGFGLFGTFHLIPQIASCRAAATSASA